MDGTTIAVQDYAKAIYALEQRLQREALGVEQPLAGGGEDAQVAQHLALRGQERRVATLAVGERLDVVGHLAVEERLAIHAREGELAPFGAVDEPGDAHASEGSCRLLIEEKVLMRLNFG